MSPIIEIQRRLVEAGRIRAGEKGAKGEPRKLDKWRLTSKDRQRLELAASLWGGEVREWSERQGEFELYTDTNQLPITLIPGQLPTTWYELWSKGGCQRRCDGQHEIISDSACLCGEERDCKPHTRLSVLLPDLPGLGSWLLSSTGWNAAAELAGAADLLSRASAQGVLIPARLRLEQRVNVKAGQTRRYAVPVIDIDVSFRELLGGQGALSAPSETRALPSGYVPISGNGGEGPTLEEGLKAAAEQTLTRTERSAAPIPAVPDDIPFGDEPVPVDDPGASSPPGAVQSAPTPTAPRASHLKPTKRQSTWLDINVAWLREPWTDEEGKRRPARIKTIDLWRKVAVHRYELDPWDKAAVRKIVDDMIVAFGGFDEDGELHWSPLRKSLNRGEAAMLRNALEAKYGAAPDDWKAKVEA